MQFFSRSAAVNGNVHRYGLPRTDLKVSLDGVQLKAGFALGGWVAFEPMGDTTMMMGDLVLTENEINPVMSKLLAEGLQVTAVHNHLLRANPPTFYLHVSGIGEPDQLARLVHLALEQSKRHWIQLRRRQALLPISASKPPRLIRLSASRARNNGGVYQFGIPRSDTIKQDGMLIPGAMGTAIAINFQLQDRGERRSQEISWHSPAR